MRLSFPPLTWTLAVALVGGAVLPALGAPAGAPSKLAIASVPNFLYTAGNPGIVAVSVEDSTGAVVTNSTAGVTLTLTGPNSFSKSVAAAAVGGVASLDTTALALPACVPTTPCLYTLKATSGALTAATATETVLADSYVVQGAAGSLGSPLGTKVTQTVTFGFNAATDVASVAVLLQGTPNLDFTESSDTCVGNHSANATCTVTVAFTPRVTGVRLGAVTLTTTSGPAVPSIYVTGQGQGAAVTFSPGTAAPLPGGLNGPDAFATDGAGNLYIADYYNSRVVKLDNVNGTLASSYDATFSANIGNFLYNGDGLAVDGAGNLFSSDYDDSIVVEVPANGGTPFTVGSGLSLPGNLAVDAAGDLFIADQNNNRIVVVPNQNGQLNTANEYVIGSGLSYPNGVAIDVNGNAFIADFDNSRVVEVPLVDGVYNTAGQIFWATGVASTPSSITLDAAGDVYVADETLGVITEIPNENGALVGADLVTLFTGLDGPDGVLYDGMGNLYICNTYDVDPNGVETFKLDLQDPPAFAYTPTQVFQTSPAQTSVVSSVGTSQLGLSTPVFSANFPGSTSTCTATLNAGFNCALNPAFEPTAVQSYTGTVSVTDNASNENAPTQILQLSGTGVQAAQTITFTDPGAQSFSTAPLALNAATTANGLSVTYALGAGSPATLNGSNLTFTGVGIVTVTASQGGSALYLPADPVTISFAVSPAQQTISLASIPTSATYGASAVSLGTTSAGASGNPVSFTLSGPGAISGNQLSLTGVGTIVVTANQAGNAEYLAAPPVTESIQVAPATLTVTAVSVPSMTYGTAPPTFAATITGWVNNDTQATAMTGAPSFSTQASSTAIVGTYALVAGPGTMVSPNYIWNFVAGNVTIIKATPVVSWSPSVTTIPYANSIGIGVLDATSTPGGTWTYSITGVGAVNANTVLNAGTYTIVGNLTPNDGTDYNTATAQIASFIVTKLVATLTPVSYPSLQNGTSAVPYDSKLPALTYTVAGLANGDTAATAFTGAALLSTTATATSPVGTYPITISQGTLAAVNYTFVFGTGSIQIIQAQAVLTWNPATTSITYGTTLGAAGFLNATANLGLSLGNITYLLNSSPVTASTVLSVGTYTIFANFTPLDLLDLKIVTLPETITVKAASLTATANNLTMTAGGAVPQLTYTLSGFVPGDTAAVVSGAPALATTATSASAAGTSYPITIGAGTLSAANYIFGSFVPGTMSVTGGPQTITFTAIALPNGGVTYGAGPFTLSATSSSGLPVTFTVSGNATIAGSTLTITGTGSITVTASQAGGTNGYLPATPVTQSFTVASASQTITLTSAALPTGNVIFGAGPFPLSATSTSGLAVTFSVAGNASIVGSSLVLSGTGPVTVTAAQAGNSDYNAAASIIQSFNVVAGTQTITFTALPTGNVSYGAGPFALSATSSSGLGVTFSVTGNASISGSSLVLTGTGPVSVIASQAGNGNYAPASVTQSFTVVAAAQTITFDALPNLSSGAGPVNLTATSSSGLPVTFAVTGPATLSGNVLTITGTGTVTVTASQSGGGNYAAAASIVQSFTVGNAYAINTAIVSDLGNPSLRNGNTVWFSSVLDAHGAQAGTVLQFQNGTINFTANGVPYSLPVPNATITFSATANATTTTFNATSQTWQTIVPLPSTRNNGFFGSFSGGFWPWSDWASSDIGAGEVFLSGTAFPVPAAGLPADVQAVTWSGTFYSSTPNVGVAWRWEANAYSSFSNNFNSLNIKPDLHFWGDAGIPQNLATSWFSGQYNDYNGAWEGTDTVDVTPGTLTLQTIKFPAIANQQNGASVNLSATASSGLPVTFTVLEGNGSLRGSTLSVYGPGTVVVEANQPGNSKFAPAPPVPQVITVTGNGFNQGQGQNQNQNCYQWNSNGNGW